MSRAALSLILGGTLLLAACGRPAVAVDPTDTPPRLRSDDPGNLAGWRLQGMARGPVRGLGPEVGVDAWLRADGWARLELTIQDRGQTRRDILIWSPTVAMLVEGRSRTVKMLGDTPGDLVLEGGVFRIEHALWLLLGRLPRSPSSLTWSNQEDDWKGRSPAVGLRGRRDRRGEVDRAEVVWRTDRGEVLHLAARVERRDGATGLPSRLALSGSLLEARVTLEWDPQAVGLMEDSTFDPLSEPGRELPGPAGG